MKKTSFSIVAAVVVLSSLTLTAAAQNRVLAQANIPFSFAAHGQTFDAGAYELRQIGAQIVRLQDVATGQGVTLLSPQTIGKSSTTNLVFRSYGTRQFLAAVVAPSYQVSIPKSQAEKEVEASATKMKTVALQVKH
jgi:hypothetical protein